MLLFGIIQRSVFTKYISWYLPNCRNDRLFGRLLSPQMEFNLQFWQNCRPSGGQDLNSWNLVHFQLQRRCSVDFGFYYCFSRNTPYSYQIAPLIKEDCYSIHSIRKIQDCFTGHGCDCDLPDSHFYGIT